MSVTKDQCEGLFVSSKQLMRLERMIRLTVTSFNSERLLIVGAKGADQ